MKQNFFHPFFCLDGKKKVLTYFSKFFMLPIIIICIFVHKLAELCPVGHLGRNKSFI